MVSEVSIELEMFLETAFPEHPEGITADRDHASRFENMMIVEPV